MTPDQIRALPASWYSSQPIPRRLLVDLGRDLAFIHRGGKIPRAVEEMLRPRSPSADLSLVELAHVRATSRLLRK